MLGPPLCLEEVISVVGSLRFLNMVCKLILVVIRLFAIDIGFSSGNAIRKVEENDNGLILNVTCQFLIYADYASLLEKTQIPRGKTERVLEDCKRIVHKNLSSPRLISENAKTKTYKALVLVV
jgi:hypothetical protein